LLDETGVPEVLPGSDVVVSGGGVVVPVEVPVDVPPVLEEPPEVDPEDEPDEDPDDDPDEDPPPDEADDDAGFNSTTKVSIRLEHPKDESEPSFPSQ